MVVSLRWQLTIKKNPWVSIRHTSAWIGFHCSRRFIKFLLLCHSAWDPVTGLRTEWFVRILWENFVGSSWSQASYVSIMFVRLWRMWATYCTVPKQFIFNKQNTRKKTATLCLASFFAITLSLLIDISSSRLKDIMGVNWYLRVLCTLVESSVILCNRNQCG